MLETNWQKCAVTVDIEGEEKDGAGKVTKSSKTSVRVTRNGSNVTRKLISHAENGKDLTEAKRSEIEGKEAAKTSRSPFHPLERKNYRFELKPSGPKDPEGSVRIAFEPIGSKTDENLTGDALVDPAAGIVSVLSMRPAKFPMFVEELAIQVVFDAPASFGKGMSSLTVNGLAVRCSSRSGSAW